MSDETGALAVAGEAFARDTAGHELTVLSDDGLYRHLRFQRVTTQEDGTRGKSSFYWFDIVTWPGCLAVNGDMDSFLFSRIEDMFEFFRGDRPNPGYWAEKVRAGAAVRRYSEDKLRQLVTEHLDDEDEERWPGLAAAVRDQVLGSGEAYCAESAERTLGDFEFGATVTASCSCGTVREGLSEDDARRWETSHRAMAPSGSGTHHVTWKQVAGFTFADAWEWDLTDWTHQFLWCCHAIPWGIAQYDAARAVTSA